jgi:hypothetical protein
MPSFEFHLFLWWHQQWNVWLPSCHLHIVSCSFLLSLCRWITLSLAARPSGKHGFSFGGTYSTSLAAFHLLAANLPKITDEPTPAGYPVATLTPDFAIPPSLGIGIARSTSPWPPLFSGQWCQWHYFWGSSSPPWTTRRCRWPTGSRRPYPTAWWYIVWSFCANDNESFQNGFDPHHGQSPSVLHSVINTALRQKDFEEKKMCITEARFLSSQNFIWNP